MTTYSRYPRGYYVYAYIRNKTTENGPAGSPYYIGKGKYNRAWQPHHTPRDQSYILILEENLTELGAFAIERRLIRWYGRLDLGTGILRNRTDGGDGSAGRIGQKHSEETKAHLSKVKKGKPGWIPSEEQKRLKSLKLKGIPHSAERAAKMGRSHKKPIVCQNVTYPSRRDAALSLGIPESTVGFRVKSKSFPDWYKITSTLS
jgi:hypothetical protein